MELGAIVAYASNVTHEEPALPPDQPQTGAGNDGPEGTTDPEKESAGLIDALTIRALLLSGAILLAMTAYWAVHRH